MEPPLNLLDLWVVYRLLTNGLQKTAPDSLLGALEYLGLDLRGTVEKDYWRAIAKRGDPFAPDEIRGLMRYCLRDADDCLSIFKQVASHIDLSRELYRGRFMSAVAEVELTGIPIDAALLEAYHDNRDSIRASLVRQGDIANVYDGDHFREARWLDFCASKQIQWPCLHDGSPSLSQKTFEQMDALYPIVRPIHQLREQLAQLRVEA